jgi:hypothetical protein
MYTVHARLLAQYYTCDYYQVVKRNWYLLRSKNDDNLRCVLSHSEVGTNVTAMIDGGVALVTHFT